MFFDICVSVTMPLVILFLILYATRQLFWEPYLRWQLLIIITPFMIGYTVSGVTNQRTLIITGILFSGLIFSWLNIFRFPPTFRTAKKQIKAKQYEKALSSLNQAIQQNPTLSELYQWRSVINLSLKYFLHAERDAKKAIELNPNFSTNFGTLGLIYASQADFKKAYEAYQKAHRLAPKVTLNQINMGVVQYKLKNHIESEKQFKKAIKNKRIAKTQRLWVHFYLGRNQEILGNQKQAQKTFRKMKHLRKAIDEIKKDWDIIPPALKESLQTDLDELEMRLNR